jgi:hypothetical protein
VYALVGIEYIVVPVDAVIEVTLFVVYNEGAK